MSYEKIPPKKLLLAIAMQLFASLVNAESVLTINFYSAETYKVSLANKPEITFEGDDLVIRCKDVSAAFSRKGIKEFYFDTSSSSIKEEVVQNTFKIEWKSSRMIYLYGEDLMPIHLFDLQGRERKVMVMDDGGNLSLDLESLEAGTYILVVNNKKNIKINLR